MIWADRAGSIQPDTVRLYVAQYGDLTVAPILNTLLGLSIILLSEGVINMVNHLRLFLTFCKLLSLLVMSFYEPVLAYWKAEWV